MVFTPKSPPFEKAIKESRNLKAKPTDDELLELYALFKQGTQDPPFADADKPGMFDIKGKYKYNAWKKVADEEMTAKQAQEKYVTLVNSLKGTYGFDG
ncbi:MAG: hypothetical protein Q9220_005945 [cf. Caloplaca sp. 1 TL-2023]